ncbi:MAG TPA: cytochrome c3 family protein [Thermoanaerobaculia bacterium]|nr:cytochrome c3 family protein [Thermoanaerobaculia bacterium]
MKRLGTCAAALALAVLAHGAPSPTLAPAPRAIAPTNTCLKCHLSLDDDTLTPPARAFQKDDVHAKTGFTCANCHGGDPTQEDMDAAHDAKKGFIGKPTHRQIPEVCAKCHADAALMKRYNPSLRVDQLSEYRTSKHGQMLATGDLHVAECASCHGAHGILPIRDTRSPVYPTWVAKTCNTCHGDAALMAGYHLPSDVYAMYMTSVHAKAMYEKGDVSAPTCNSCHGNHGATPPAVTSVANVCGTCHAVFADKFRASAHSHAFADMGLPGCVTCHGNHDIAKPTEEFLGTGPNGRCGSCHEKGDRCDVATSAMHQDIVALRTRIEAAHRILETASEAGMEVSKQKFDLTSAEESLTKARTDVHELQLAAVRKDVEEGLGVARKAEAAGHGAMAERTYRRRGLLLSLVFILVTIAALVALIRSRG